MRPRSYIQSGNMVVDREINATGMEDAIEAAKGFRPRVMVIAAEAFRDIVVQNPFTEPEGKLLHIWFAASAFTFDQEKVDSLRADSEALHIGA